MKGHDFFKNTTLCKESLKIIIDLCLLILMQTQTQTRNRQQAMPSPPFPKNTRREGRRRERKKWEGNMS
jgi:hypothetical protein